MSTALVARGIRLHPADDVAITTQEAAAGTRLDTGDGLISLRQDIPRGHKLAVRDIAEGAAVRRYGQVIGFARADIRAGEHVHVHNLEYREFEREYRFSRWNLSLYFDVQNASLTKEVLGYHLVEDPGTSAEAVRSWVLSAEVRSAWRRRWKRCSPASRRTERRPAT